MTILLEIVLVVLGLILLASGADYLVDGSSKIEDKDWQNLIQVFLDYTVRSNQSFFLNMTDSGKQMYDIFSCERYATEKPRRRPVMKPKYENPGDLSDSRLVRLISGLITSDLGLADDNQTQREYFNVISLPPLTFLR